MTMQSGRRWGRLSAVAALLALGFAGPSDAKAPAAASSTTATAAERYTLQGKSIEIHNIAGELHIEPGTGTQTVIEVRRGGKDGASLRVVTDEQAGVSSLRVIYPEDEIVYPPLGRGTQSTFNVTGDGRIADRDSKFDDDLRRVIVSGKGPGLEAHADLRVLVPPGRSLRVAVAAGAMQIARANGTFDLEVHAGSVDASGVHGNLKVQTSSGSVSARDHVGDLIITTGSGEVLLDAAKGGRIEAETGSGEIAAQRIDATAFAASTGSGEIEIGSVRAPRVEVSTGSGSVDVDFGTDIEDVEISTGSGSITVHVPRGFGARIEAACGSGGIESSVPMEVTSRKRHSLKGRLGDGRGLLRVETGSGSIRFEPRPRSGTHLNLGAGVFMQAVE